MIPVDPVSKLVSAGLTYSRGQNSTILKKGERIVFYIGCPMWGYKEWVGTFFPPRTAQSDFLRLYSRRLLTVEGNTTFYALPTAQVIAHWRSETPPGFHFCPKISRDISHAQR